MTNPNGIVRQVFREAIISVPEEAAERLRELDGKIAALRPRLAAGLLELAELEEMRSQIFPTVEEI